jgi:predicted O-methyltransferase YrrM
MLIDSAYFNFPDFYAQVANTSHWTDFVEVGVYTGASVCFLAQKLKERGLPFKLHAVDLWELAATTDYKDLPMGVEVWEALKERMALTGTSYDIQIHKMASVDASNQFAHASLDFIFIDADHSYEAVKRDIKAWWPKLRPHGMIAGHDILEKTCGVEKAVKEIFGNNYQIVNNCWTVPRGTM